MSSKTSKEIWCLDGAIWMNRSAEKLWEDRRNGLPLLTNYWGRLIGDVKMLDDGEGHAETHFTPNMQWLCIKNSVLSLFIYK